MIIEAKATIGAAVAVLGTAFVMSIGFRLGSDAYSYVQKKRLQRKIRQYREKHPELALPKDKDEGDSRPLTQAEQAAVMKAVQEGAIA